MSESAVPRGPLSVTCDARLRSALASYALRAALTPAAVARVFAMWLLLGLVFWFASGAFAPFLVVGVVMPATLLGLTVLRTLRSVRAALPIGGVVTSSYDAQGRLVITRATGERVLGAGWADAVERRGDVAVIRRRGRRTAPLVTPSALVTEEDAARLTSGVSAPDTGLRHQLVVTPAVQKDMYAGQLRAMVRHPAMIAIVVLVVICAVLVALLPAGLAWRMGLLLAVALGFVFVVMPRVGIRQLYPVGAVLSADVSEDALLLDIPGLPSRIPLDRLDAVERTPHCLVLHRRGSARRLVLPRDLLPADVLGDEARPSAAH